MINIRKKNQTESNKAIKADCQTKGAQTADSHSLRECLRRCLSTITLHKLVRKTFGKER